MVISRRIPGRHTITSISLEIPMSIQSFTFFRIQGKFLKGQASRLKNPTIATNMMRLTRT